MPGQCAGDSAILYEKLKETARETAIYGVGSVLNKVAGFLLLPLYTKFLTPAEFGVVGLLLVTELAAAIVIQCGLQTAFFRSYFEYEDEDRREVVVSTTFWYLVVAGALILVPFVFAAGALSELILGLPGQGNLFRCVILFAYLDVLNLIPFAVLKVRKGSVRFTVASTCSFVFQLLVTIALVAWYGLGPWGVMLGYVAGNLLEAAILFPAITKEIRWRFSFTELRIMLVYGAPFIFAQVANNLILMVDRFFVKHYVNLDEVGLYTLGNTIAGIVVIVLAQPFGLIWPYAKLSVMKRDDAGQFYSRILTYLTFGAVYISLGITCVTADVLHFGAPPPYWRTAAVVPVLALYYVCVTLNKALNVGVTITRKSQWNAITAASIAIINIGLNFALIPRWGMMGAAWASFLSFLLYNVLRAWVSHLFYPVHYEWWRVTKILAAGVGIYFVTQMLELGHPFADVAAKGVIALLFPAILWAIGFYDEKEKRKLREWRGLGLSWLFRSDPARGITK